MNSEQSLIEKYLLPLAGNKESLLLKNDAAFFKEKGLVISTDMMLEDKHFSKDCDPRKLAKKLLRINLSDIAAMGARPLGFFLNIAMPKTKINRWFQGFVSGLKSDMGRYNLKLFGGDLSCSSKVFLSVTILGKIKDNCHLKNHTNKNSDIFVTGSIGDAGLGFQLNEKFSFFNCSINNKRKLIQKHLLPEPRLNVGINLLNQAEFCTDISDGLIEEISLIAHRSKKQANIFLEKIPISLATKEILDKNINKSKQIWEIILFGGEDYELLFSMLKKKKITSKTVKISKIGFFSNGNGVRIFDENGKEFLTKKRGFSHF